MTVVEENVELVSLLIWIGERLAGDPHYADVVARINAWHDGTYLERWGRDKQGYRESAPGPAPTGNDNSPYAKLRR